jgi:hypothetical protein
MRAGAKWGNFALEFSRWVRWDRNYFLDGTICERREVLEAADRLITGPVLEN